MVKGPGPSLKTLWKSDEAASESRGEAAEAASAMAEDSSTATALSVPDAVLITSRRPQHHAVAIPVTGQGHLNPLMRFCRALSASSHTPGFAITFVTTDFIQRRLQYVAHEQPAKNTPTRVEGDDHETTAVNHEANGKSTSGRVSSADDHLQGESSTTADIFFSSAHIAIEGLELGSDFRVPVERLFQALNRHMPAALDCLLHNLLAQGRPPVTCLISDIQLINGPTKPVANSFHLPRIAFYPCSAAALLLSLHVLTGDHISYTQVKEALKTSREQGCREVFCEGLPGLPTALYNTDLFYCNRVPGENDYIWENCILGALEETLMSKAHALVVNSFDALEGPALRTLRKLLSIPVYEVGPLVEPLEGSYSTSLWKEDENCLLWLDKQPVGSVLYISFGSVTLLSQVQFEEIVAGLFACEQRFLWVFRPDLIENSAYTTFPMDLLGKAQGKGYVVKWAPQVKVLSHPSVGGFLTHCGWNSTIEGIAHGVPMLCWPYFADQFLNAKYVVEEWKIGFRFEEEDGAAGKQQLIKRDQVERVIRALDMQGEQGKGMRGRVEKLKEAGHASLQPGAGGQSWENLTTLVLSLG